MLIPRSKDEQDDVKELMRRHLRNTAVGKWLLIVDNADNRHVLSRPALSKGIVGYLPESADGLISFTSRRQHVS